MTNKNQEGHQNSKPRVMFIDDNVVNLNVERKALDKAYSVIPVTSGVEALTLLKRVLPSLILLDIDMPVMDGFETIKHLKSDERTKGIPVIFLTAKDDDSSEMEGFDLGAVDYITKPFSIPLLMQRVNLHIELIEQKNELENFNKNLTAMVKEKTKTIEEMHYAIIHALSDLIECRDDLTGGHVARTQEYLQVLIDEILSDEQYQKDFENVDIDILIASAQLHDIGKVGIPDEILNKPGKLTDEEFDVIKTHPVAGENALKGAMEMTSEKDFLSHAAIIAISHHEKWDGTGYPYGLKGEEIPLIGRLMAIVDVYDALVSDRPYKNAFSHEVAVDIIKNESGRHFDPALVDVFIKKADFFEKPNQAKE